MMIAKTSLVFQQIKQDLLPFKFRFATTWRIALLCALMAGIAMLYEIPESAISCYLIIYLVKADAVENILLCIGVMLLSSIAVCVIFILFNLTLQDVMLRFFFMALFSGLFMYLSSASSLGDIGNLIALVIAFLMTLIDDIPFSDAATRGLLYALLMAVSPMLLVIIFNYFFGISPRKLLINKLSERFVSAQQFFLAREPSAIKVTQALSTQAECKRYLMLIKLFFLKGKKDIQWLDSMIDNSYEILIMSLSLPDNTPTAIRVALSEKCQFIAQCLSENQCLSEDQKNRLGVLKNESINSPEYQSLLTDFHSILFKPKVISDPKIKMPFFVEDAFTNPNHKYFAIKTTCAALICYVFYDYFAWQGIHTAMITCYVVALTSVGETVHKLTLRIIGCLIGAFIGIISLIYIIPHLSDVFSLMVLIFFCILPAAWVAAGNERISYAGVQVGLAFLLTVLHGFKPSFDLDVASDRILGILLGNIVMYIMFTKVWPVSIMTAINKQIKSILASYTALKLKSYDNNVQALSLVAAINEGIIKSKDDINLLIFETQFKDKNGALIRFFKQLLDQISVDSYQNYSVNFSSFNHKDTLDINADSISISDFKRDVLDSVPTTLSAQEKEPVIQELISEKS
ncbi:FUSC family protein [Moellerella wisconsensis]|uniref:FUSC family protein n=1 Tax=Moellerella wisconsensis TaxID=158849 RepID=A0ACD3Y7W0_9GAMM|nr:FUSC family protein [Moellerella wisconsensis]KLN96640.1 multidrug transporter [Moellerella wisconsensis]UNH24517.1 FUSC family protein [Moellerella wisconsensis]UNH27622.1 FUSC family protein [Moellerella wisconsensis]UNH39242.1 FUSC family protein [Moellerella wisconsensis]UNH42764.1 FUSC family protein [Moellerella wisconsensis]